MPRRISYAQNGEDVRIWHAFGPRPEQGDAPALTYVEVGANEPRDMSLTAALYDLGWRGLLIEADPELAERLRLYRSGDVVFNAVAADFTGEVTFYRVPGTGLGTMDPREANVAADRGFHVQAQTIDTRTLDDMLDEFLPGAAPIHALSIDVEGAEADVLGGLSLVRHRPWVMCIEAVEPGTSTPSHDAWEHHVIDRDYRMAAFDGINRWYVANEVADRAVSDSAGAPVGMTIAEAISMPFNIVDAGYHGWTSQETDQLHETSNKAFNRAAWQREVILHDNEQAVPTQEYERQIEELRSALVDVQGSRTYALSRKASTAAKRLRAAAQRTRSALPTPATERLVRERHLKHVTTNMGHLTPAAFLTSSTEPDGTLFDQPGEESVHWLGTAREGVPLARPPVPPGTDLSGVTAKQAQEIRAWLSEYPFDADAELDARMDNHDDEVGRAQAALRTRLRLLDGQGAQSSGRRGNLIAFDARALQAPEFAKRGIGRFAYALLAGARAAVSDARVRLIVDPGLPSLPHDIADGCTVMTRIKASEVGHFGALIQPSPMTHSPDPLVPLATADLYKLAVVFDFIPLHFRDIYLGNVAARAEYAANLDALTHYNDYLAISHVAAAETATLLAARSQIADDTVIRVAWPSELDLSGAATSVVNTHGPIVLMAGDDARKNTFGGLAGIAAATSHEANRNVVVVGMAGQETRVHHWSIAAAMRPGEADTLGRVGDEGLTDLLHSASCVVVPSFDEGLSLPVIEALRVGVPVVASDIPAHRELIGTGDFLCDPRSPRSIARAVKRVRGSSKTAERQAARLANHHHEALDRVVAASIARHVPAESEPAGTSTDGIADRKNRMSMGIATPWPPQQSGVADFSQTVFAELAELADVTIYTTADAGSVESAKIKQRPIADVFDSPGSIQAEHDVFVSVVGNSHYHLLSVELLRFLDAIVVAHDTRMVEFYMALRGKAGAERVMSTTSGERSRPVSHLSLDDQVDDMRLLTNTGMWEVANRAEKVILHSPSAQPTIARETGRDIQLLPFANYRVPPTATITDDDRAAARMRLGLDGYSAETIHVGSFGYIDVRTKMTDIVVESAAWLAQWGVPVALHLIGSAGGAQGEQLLKRAHRAGLDNLHITGFVSDDEYRDWVLAVDVAVQLRISPMLGVSGPLSDLAAYGTPVVASNGLCVDVGAPEFVHRLPDSVSPVLVAEALESFIRNPIGAEEIERQRLQYLDDKSPGRYAELLMTMLQESS